MDKNDNEDVFKLVEGLKPVDPKKLVEFERTMKDEVVPDIVKAVEQRRLFAAESRVRQRKS
jgi:hypothetical protein